MYNAQMKKNRNGHLVQFRYRDGVLYGEILQEKKDEEGKPVYMIQAGDKVIRGIREEDLIRDYGGA